MYRRRTKGSQKYNDRMARARAAKDLLRLDGPVPNYPPDLPDVRRRLIVEDYDCGEAVRHEFVLHRSGRIDCYLVCVDGKMIPGRFGWSMVLAMVRKAFVRVGNFV